MIRLKDKLSHLTFREACKLLGPDGEGLIRTGGRYDIDISEEVVLRMREMEGNAEMAGEMGLGEMGSSLLLTLEG